MKTLAKILGLEIENFAGHQQLIINAEGHDVDVRGENFSGKTTIGHAILWLLTGKNLDGQKAFEIKPYDDTGKHKKGATIVVKAEFVLDSGERIAVERRQKENWSTKRGSTTAELVGNDTECSWCGVPKSVSEFESLIERTFGSMDRIHDVMVPTHFLRNRDWKDRRSILVELAGDVTEEDVIKTNPTLAGVPDIRGGRSVDDAKSVLDAQRKKLAEVKALMPAKLNEAMRGVDDHLEAPVNLDALKLAYQESVNALASLSAGSATEEARSAIRALESQREELVLQLRAAEGASYGVVQKEVHDANEALQSARLARTALQLGKEGTEERLKEANDLLDTIKSAWAAIHQEEFTWTGVESCAACGQALPEGAVKSAREVAEEHWNTSISERKENIQLRANETKSRISALTTELAQKEANIEAANAAVEAAEQSLSNAKSKLEAIQQPRQDWSNHPDVAKLSTEILIAKEKLADSSGTVDARRSELEAAKQSAAEKLETAQRQLAAWESSEKARSRVKELESEGQKIADELAATEKKLGLLEAYQNAWALLLTDRINSMFSMVDWKLFETQLNGGTKQTCIATIRRTGAGVPGSASTSESIRAGIDCIQALTERGYAPALPIVIDYCESVHPLPSTAAQQFRLRHIEGLKGLHISAAKAKELQTA